MLSPDSGVTNTSTSYNTWNTAAIKAFRLRDGFNERGDRAPDNNHKLWVTLKKHSVCVSGKLVNVKLHRAFGKSTTFVTNCQVSSTNDNEREKAELNNNTDVLQNVG